MHSVLTGILHDYSRSTQILITWGEESSGYAENLDNRFKKIVYIGSLNGKKTFLHAAVLYLFAYKWNIYTQFLACIWQMWEKFKAKKYVVQLE
jgi:hypothetical protein